MSRPFPYLTTPRRLVVFCDIDGTLNTWDPDPATQHPAYPGAMCRFPLAGEFFRMLLQETDVWWLTAWTYHSPFMPESRLAELEWLLGVPRDVLARGYCTQFEPHSVTEEGPRPSPAWPSLGISTSVSAGSPQ